MIAFHYGIGGRLERPRESCVGHLTLVLRDQVPNAAVPVNQLGLTVKYVRVDEAFK